MRISRIALLAACVASSSAVRIPTTRARPAGVHHRRSIPLRACADAEPAPAPLETYADAEARGLQLASEGAYERAIRMFELAQTLPGDGVDYVREKQGGMIGSATAPPNPREWGQKRFATPEQKLIAQYNIACCCAKMGDTPRAMEILEGYVMQVGEPLNQINEMMVDDDLITVRTELRALRDQFKAPAKKGLFGLPSFKNPLKEAAETIGVEWKD